MGYPAYWIRDSVMMLGDTFVPAAEIEGWIRLIGQTLLTRDWNVRTGVVVPAFAVPDHINFNGKPTFYPGNYETGNLQGGPPWGKYPPLDDAFYFLTAVYEHWKMTHSLSLFNADVQTASGKIKLADLCERVYRVAPIDAGTGLVIAGDVDHENAKDFGFCDGVFKSGKLLFPSVLKFLASQQLAALFRADGDPVKAARYEQIAEQIRRAIPQTFLHRDGADTWLHSSTGVGNQPDVWGMAFAIWSGALDGQPAKAVAQSLTRAYRGKTAVRDGCVRHILTDDPKNHGGWEKSVSPLSEYQNGGYWGTATGWYVAAISKVDRNAASDMARDYLHFLRANTRPDGMPEAWEWFNPDTGKHANPLYVATVALPYISLRQAGLLADR